MNQVLVLYRFQEYNKINGTLFYCYEYYQMLKSLNIKASIIVFGNIKDKDQELILKVFDDKYVMNDGIIFLNYRTKLYQHIIQSNKILILDTNTYLNIQDFLGKSKVYLFCNKHIKDTNYKDSIVYGSYDLYQKFDHFDYLRINFDIYKPIINVDNKIFISSPEYDLIDNKYKKDNKYLIKQHNVTYDNLLSRISKVIYIHTCIDTNNRILVEASYFGIAYDIINHITTVDSIVLRDLDISQGNINNYVLSKDSSLMQSLLKQ